MSSFEKLYEKTLRSLEEALGIPTNVVEEAERVYEELLEMSKTCQNNSEIYKKTFLDFNLQIKEQTFRNMMIFLTFHRTEKESGIHNASSLFGYELNLTTRRIKIIDGDVIALMLVCDLPKEGDQRELKDYLKKSKDHVVSILSHELHHYFSSRMQKSVKFEQSAFYSAISKVKIGIPTIDRFIEALYLTTAAESLVQPSEVFAKIKLNNITKGQFFDFFQSHEILKRLRSASLLTFEDFVEDLKNEEDNLDQFLLKHIDIAKLTTKEKINQALKIAVGLLIKEKADYYAKYYKLAYRDAVNQNGLQNTLDKKDIEETLKNIQKDLRKYVGREREFFSDYLKIVNIKASKTLKKIGKLYALCEEDETREDIALGLVESAEDKSVEEVLEELWRISYE